jgi:hypothetical protein
VGVDAGAAAGTNLRLEQLHHFVGEASVAEDNAEELLDSLLDHGVPYAVLGTVGGERLTIEGKVDVSLDDLRDAFEPALEALVAGTISSDELHEG